MRYGMSVTYIRFLMNGAKVKRLYNGNVKYAYVSDEETIGRYEEGVLEKQGLCCQSGSFYDILIRYAI